MTDDAFDAALIGAAFAAIAQHGWRNWSVAAVARAQDLDLARARARFPTPQAVVLQLGLLADQAALRDPTNAPDASLQEQLFDMLMRRIDVLQLHRAGVLALLHALPADPVTAAMLAAADLRSMRWLLEAAGPPAPFALRTLHAEGLLGVWLWTLRAWSRDDSPDLAATMAALDTALARAAQIARSLTGPGEALPTSRERAHGPVNECERHETIHERPDE